MKAIPNREIEPRPTQPQDSYMFLESNFYDKYLVRNTQTALKSFEKKKRKK